MSECRRRKGASGAVVALATAAGISLMAAPGLARLQTPPKPDPAGTFSGTIGGQPWSAAQGVRALNSGAVVSVGGSDKQFIVSIGMSVKRGVGQYRAGSLAAEDFAKLTKEQFADLIDRNSVVASVIDTVNKRGWQAGPTIGKGTVNLTSMSGSAVGTFSLTLEPVPNTGASGSLNFSGSFNIRF